MLFDPRHTEKPSTKLQDFLYIVGKFFTVLATLGFVVLLSMGYFF